MTAVIIHTPTVIISLILYVISYPMLLSAHPSHCHCCPGQLNGKTRRGKHDDELSCGRKTTTTCGRTCFVFHGKDRDKQQNWPPSQEEKKIGNQNH